MRNVAQRLYLLLFIRSDDAVGKGGACSFRCVGTKAVKAAKEDLFVVMARRLVYVGLVFLPLLHYRVGKAFDLSDLCFLIAAVFMILTRRPPPKAPPAPAWYFGSFVFVLAGVVASAQAVSKTSSLQVVFNAIFVFFVLQWMLRQLLNNAERIRAGMVAFILGSSVSAFVAFLQTEFHVLGYSHQASLEGSAPSA